MTKSELVRFSTKLCVDPITGCWDWIGGLYNNGYGMFFASGRSRRAHRVSYEHFIGPLGALDCCHKCDNRRCVNPDHLFAGTASDNMLDASRKGRHGSKTHRASWLGERNSSSKLTENQVSEIRALLQCGITGVSLARKYGVSGTMVSLIKRGKNWPHVQALAHAEKLI